MRTHTYAHICILSIYILPIQNITSVINNIRKNSIVEAWVRGAEVLRLGSERWEPVRHGSGGQGLLRLVSS